MATLVPPFEELLIRSLTLRSFHRSRQTLVGLVQIAEDIPILGEWLLQTKLGRETGKSPVSFASEFRRAPLGKLTLFGVCASTFIFMLSHHLRDWPAIWPCGIAYCVLLAVTREKGLGPVIWAHCITNALLWVYTLYTGDWQFL